LKQETALYKRTVFANGLKVISEAIPYVRSVSLGLWLNVGSRDESEASSGVSHFIEHMVFKGTQKRNASEIASCIESVGGILNAFTSREETCFYVKIIDEHLDLAIELLFDLINNALYKVDEIEKEKRVILEEIKDIDDSPSDLVHDKFAQAIFGKHPLGRPIQGTRASVKSIDRKKILGHLRKLYRPDRMLVAASGNLKHERLVDLVTANFDSKIYGKSVDGRKEPKYKPLRKSYLNKSSQSHVCLGIPAKQFDHPSRTPLLVLNSLLGGGMSSRLFQHLREDLGLVYNVYSYLDYFQDTGIFGFYLATDKKNLKRSIAVIMQELDRISNNYLSDLELAKLKAQLKGNLMLGLENTSSRMNRLAKHELLIGRYVTLDETIGCIDSVTSQQVTEIAREIFVKDKFTAVILGPNVKDVYEPLE
jgi:predicted Zn-dependent peptidase